MFGLTTVKTMTVKEIVVARAVAIANLAPKTVAALQVMKERVIVAGLMMRKKRTIAAGLVMMRRPKAAKIRTLMERVAKRVHLTIMLMNPAKRTIKMHQRKIIRFLIYLADFAPQKSGVSRIELRSAPKD